MDSIRRRLIPLIVLLAAVVTACDGDGGDAGDGGDGAATTIETVATEFAFDPDTWTAAADREVTIELANEGQIEHEWVVLEEGTTIAEESEFSEDLAVFEIEAAAGESATGSFTLPAGTYQVICAIPGHFSSGMEGSLTLE